ncbi:Aste57867_19818 [Aphanomyces stellatus]|uniref:Aste57867_19818 protein n=1 Tax=Aphanomyces stellatus TaxID=120398 RepID=A0A485LDI4_9STRA|nr:hypothetical protein As57867_019753 [Aphanomyces stellatus]VFT96516.1 Aste57867_19818 [Aphanomyces stellatus]
MSPVPPPPAPVAAPPSNAAVRKTTIDLTSTAERAQVAAADATSLFVNCHLVAPPCDDAERKPIDVVVVLDRSGSMAGEKLTLCKKTLDFLAQQLGPQDRVALITYDTHVRTDVKLTKMSAHGKVLLANKVAAVTAGSMTNLSGGLLAGIEEIQTPRRADNDEPNPVQSVLLLTDGQANEGITTADGLAKMLAGVLAPTVSLHTFGYGSDHDATLLGRLADLGRGSYYFVQNVDRVALAFADCLGGLLSVVAQNIKVEVVAAPGVTIAAVKTKRPVAVVTDHVHMEVEMGDLFADETRDLLVHVTLQPRATPTTNALDTVELVEFRVRYANVLTSSLDKAASTVSIQRPVTVTDHALDEWVMLQKQRVEAAEAIETAQEHAARGDYMQSREVLQRRVASMQSHAAAMSSEGQTKLSYMLNDLAECQSNVANADIYRMRGAGRMQQKMQTTWMQRANDIEINESELDDEECAKPSGLNMFAAPQAAPAAPVGFSAAAPRNSAQRSMMKKAFNLK